MSCKGPYGCRWGAAQPVVEVHWQVTIWSLQMFCAHTAGELGSGTSFGLGLRVKLSLEASSSLK